MEISSWLDEFLPKHARLTESIQSITKSLLEENGVEYLSVTGRTKLKRSIIEKIKRKNYKNPHVEMTDISGIRIILFIESDISKVGSIIENSFNVDWSHSSNKDEAMPSNEVGYRSVHFVCDIGEKRAKLPEFKGLDALKFEFQIRTVLQHAWAELAHDRSYKFRGSLPKEIQRKLYLHAGLLEIADKGFSEIAKDIDNYTQNVVGKYKAGNLDVSINSISIREFMDEWAQRNDFPLEEIHATAPLDDLISELSAFKITKISQLNEIIPDDYVETAKSLGLKTNLFGAIRDWLLIKDAGILVYDVKVSWTIGEEDKIGIALFEKLSTPKNLAIINKKIFDDIDEDDYEDEEDS